MLGVLSSPQEKYFLTYLCGLIWIVKFRSIRMIAGQFGKKDTDGLHHFIRHASNKAKRITTASQDFVATQIRGQTVRLVLDDTPSPARRQKDRRAGIAPRHQGNRQRVVCRYGRCASRRANMGVGDHRILFP